MKPFNALSVVLLAVVSVATAASGQSSCSATNDQGDSCSVTCPEGQAAACFNATGANAPSCSCSTASAARTSVKNGTQKNLSVDVPIRFQMPLALKHIMVPDGVQSINVADVVNAKLAGLADHHLSDACTQDVVPSPPPHERQDTGHFGGPGRAKAQSSISAATPAVATVTCRPIRGKLTVQSPLLLSSAPTVILSEPNWKGIPADVSTLHMSFKNCSPLTQDQPETHVVNETLGSTVSNTKSLATGSSNSVSLHAGFKIGIVDFGANDTMSVNTQTTLSDTATQNHTQQFTDSLGLSIHAAAMMDTETSHSVMQYYVPVQYSGNVVVDGSITTNLDGITKLSQIFPNEADRTFAFSGVITTTLIDAKTVLNATPLLATDCAKTPGQVSINTSNTLSTTVSQ